MTPLEVATIARDMTTASSAAARLAILEPGRVADIAAHIEHAHNLGTALVRALKADT